VNADRRAWAARWRRRFSRATADGLAGRLIRVLAGGDVMRKIADRFMSACSFIAMLARCARGSWAMMCAALAIDALPARWARCLH
jgi:hypothetical protein